MGIISSIFRKNSVPKISTYEEFWTWFLHNEHTFFKIIRSGKNIDKAFFPRLSPMLDQLHNGILLMTAVDDKGNVELALSAAAEVKIIPYIEDIIDAAPSIPGWKFTSLKPAIDMDKTMLKMAGKIFSIDNMFFYENEDPNMRDNIDLVIIHSDFMESDRSNFEIGGSMFLENYLGELNMLTMIDSLEFIAKEDAKAVLIPIFKLMDYLIWREKEFVEKYGDLRYLEEDDRRNCLEWKLENGKPLFAIVNSSVLEWDGKASHPWVIEISIKYNGAEDNGLPDSRTAELLDQFQDQLVEQLQAPEGFLHISVETADGLSRICFACADFRKPVRVVDRTIREFKGQLEVEYEVYRDKYWQTFERYTPQVL
ncbi:DUF695 domain-containing protein [Pedobacter sp. MC2016-15]|uniref:DUF695 domain-containing protein n=1 Tax=Pedobacter sp. MC2016-15 TaxID=2994473 RepID=UPI0022453DD8|nr:DUF695 domain-containing protein [Pedobacter sp. MC2016-15]MCX2478321.1 DUF695 domain-containing protein [Pedobacter sp. MC2016-15]